MKLRSQRNINDVKSKWLNYYRRKNERRTNGVSEKKKHYDNLDTLTELHALGFQTSTTSAINDQHQPNQHQQKDQYHGISVHYTQYNNSLMTHPDRRNYILSENERSTRPKHGRS